MSDKLPWFPFYATDWISDSKVRLMTSRQKGWYIDLLAFAWQEGGIPEATKGCELLTSYSRDEIDVDYSDDPSVDRKVLQEEFDAVLSMFSVVTSNGRLTHPKLAAYSHQISEKRKRQQEAAESTNAKRNAKRSSKRTLRASDSGSVSNSSSEVNQKRKEKKTRENDPREVWFSEFWDLYWRKVSKKKARDAYFVHVTGEEMRDKVRAAVIGQRPYMLSKEPHGRPHGASWLNGLRWDDEIEPPVNGARRSNVDRLFDEIAAEREAGA